MNFNCSCILAQFFLSRMQLIPFDSTNTTRKEGEIMRYVGSGPGGGRGYSIKFYTGGLPLEVQTLTIEFPVIATFLPGYQSF